MGNSLVVQWLGLHAFTAKGPGSIPGQGTKIRQAAWRPKTKQNGKIMFGDIHAMEPLRVSQPQRY